MVVPQSHKVATVAPQFQNHEDKPCKSVYEPIFLQVCLAPQLAPSSVSEWLLWTFPHTKVPTAIVLLEAHPFQSEPNGGGTHRQRTTVVEIL